MKKIFLILSLCCCSTLLCAQAAKPVKTPSKIAVVDAEKVYEKYLQREVYEKELKRIADAAEASLEKLNEERIKLRRSYESAREEVDASFSLNDKEVQTKRDLAQKLYREWKAKEMECENFTKTFREKQKLAFEDMRDKLKNEIRAVIRSRATIEGYEMVLDSSAKSMTELNVVLYNVQRLDLTDKVIEDLNKGR